MPCLKCPAVNSMGTADTISVQTGLDPTKANVIKQIINLLADSRIPLYRVNEVFEGVKICLNDRAAEPVGHVSDIRATIERYVHYHDVRT